MSNRTVRSSLVKAAAGLATGASVLLVGAGAASATTPSDKPVISYAAGSWGLTHEYGYSFTAGGRVYLDWQDVTTDPNDNSPLYPTEVTADGQGQIAVTRSIGNGHCFHTIRVWAWDYGKSPNPAYQWSTRTFTMQCN